MKLGTYGPLASPASDSDASCKLRSLALQVAFPSGVLIAYVRWCLLAYEARYDPVFYQNWVGGREGGASRSVVSTPR